MSVFISHYKCVIDVFLTYITLLIMDLINRRSLHHNNKGSAIIIPYSYVLCVLGWKKNIIIYYWFYYWNRIFYIPRTTSYYYKNYNKVDYTQTSYYSGRELMFNISVSWWLPTGCCLWNIIQNAIFCHFSHWEIDLSQHFSFH